MNTRKTILVASGLGALLLALPSPAGAQIRIGVGIDVVFPEPPPLVVVSPGIRIVPEFEEEVFFLNGFYWLRRDEGWYRTRDHRGGWAPVRVVVVPPALVRIPPGHYRHYYRDDDGYWRPHDREAFRSWRERHPVDQRRTWWREHRHDKKVRWEQERSWREKRRDHRQAERTRDGGRDDRRDERREDRGDGRREHGHGRGH